MNGEKMRAIEENDHDLCFHLSLLSYFCYQFDGAADLTQTTKCFLVQSFDTEKKRIFFSLSVLKRAPVYRLHCTNLAKQSLTRKA